MASQKLITVRVRNTKTEAITEHRVLATMIGDYGIHKLPLDFTDTNNLVFGEEWTITAPNGHGLGRFETKKDALACAADLKEFSTAAALVVISQKNKKRRTVEEIAIVNMVKHIVEQYMPIEEGEL